MTERYNIYFAGRLVDGHDLDSVRKNLAQVFKADEQTLDKLFSGRRRLVKSDCDKATALKYKTVMQRAGAELIISLIKADTKEPNAAPQKAPTAAERIATLAATSTEEHFEATTSAAQQAGLSRTASISLAPPATDVLKISERAVKFIRSVNTAGLELDKFGQRLSERLSPAPAIPDISHLNVAEVGETIPHLRGTKDLITPNIDDLTLSSQGFDFSDCAPPDATLLPHDLSSLSLVPLND